MFSTLSESELDDVVDAMQDYHAREGDVIIKEGDPGDCFYILEEGILLLLSYYIILSLLLLLSSQQLLLLLLLLLQQQ